MARAFERLVWEVVGGSDRGGIVVRTGAATSSPEVGDRLATGSLVTQVGPLENQGSRLHYQLLHGKGPPEGWVSASIKGKALLDPDPWKLRAPPIPSDPQVRDKLGKEVDLKVQERIRSDSIKVGSSSFESPWLPFGSDMGSAGVRLFVFFGAGKSAAQYREWTQIAEDTVSTVAVHPVEYPGKGRNSAKTVSSANDMAEIFIKDVLDPVSQDGAPFALFGFSIGARIAYEIARRRPPLRLYVAGRAAPFLGARGTELDKLGEGTMPEDPKEFLEWVIAAAWGTQDVIRRIIEQSEQEDNAKAYLQKYAEPIRNELDINWTEIVNHDIFGTELNAQPCCRVRAFDGGQDTTWPPSKIKDGWDHYDPGCNACKKTYPSLDHEKLCPPNGGPLLKDVLEDLHALLYS